MVGRVPEVRDLLRVADGRSVVVRYDPVGHDAVEERPGAVHVVDAGTAARRGIEIVGMALVDHVDIRRLRQDIVVHQQPGIIFRVLIHPVVHAGAAVEVSHHHPVLAGGFASGQGADRVLADVLHLGTTVIVTLSGSPAPLPVFLRNAIAVGLRPGMQRHDIQLLAVDPETCPARSVADQRVALPVMRATSSIG